MYDIPSIHGLSLYSMVVEKQLNREGEDKYIPVGKTIGISNRTENYEAVVVSSVMPPTLAITS